MVKVLLSLKWKYVLAQFKGNVWSIIGTVIAALYGLGAVVGIGAAMVFLGEESALNVGAGILLLGVILTVLWWVVPVFTSGVDATLDPDRLVLFPLKHSQMQLAQFLGAFIGIPGVISVLLMATTLLAVFRQPLVLIIAAVGIALQLALAMTASRLITLLAYRIASKRYLGTIMTMIAFFLLIAASPLLMGATNFLTNSWELVRSVLFVLAWTPLGAGLGAVSSAYQGAWGLALCQLVLGLGCLGLLWFLWGKLLNHAMNNAGEFKGVASAKDVGSGKLGLFDKFPATPRGAIAARTVYVLLKDSRANANIYIIPMMYIVFGFLGKISFGEDGGNSFYNIFMMIFLPVTAGYVFAYLVSYDSSAFSQHVYSAVRGIDDRWGRATGLMVLMLPMIIVGTIFMTLVNQTPVHLVINLGISLGLLFTAVGVSAFTDMLISVPVPPPGSSAFKMPKQNDGFAKGMARMGIMLIIMAFSIPGFALYITFAVTENPLWAILGGVVDLAIGVAVLLIGIKIGAQRFDRLAPEALQRVSKFTQ